MESKERKMRPVEFLVVAYDENSGYKEVFRTIHIQGLESRIVKAMASGKPMEGLLWKKVPVRYRCMVKATGQEVWCRYDAGRKAFVAEEGGVEFNVRQLSSYEEVVCSE